ncbi:MAG: DNA-binding transcriptional repressor AcrR [Syntrophorhabdus sp. PtaU1.Bin058]|nr:MAG: DNA-binding transcriptional repressor AcrR [Syntrophorhabdus sp. PtaU1.Bin058]
MKQKRPVMPGMFIFDAGPDGTGFFLGAIGFLRERTIHMRTGRNENIRWTDRQIKRIKAIARVSIELFSAKGYLETSMDDIARALRTTKGGIYHYFRRKEEILYFICSTCTELKLRGLEEVSVETGDGAERVRLVISHLVDHCTANVKATRTSLNELRNLSPKHLKIINAKEECCREIVTEAIAGFLGRPRNKQIVRALSLAFLGIIDRLCLQYDPKNDMGPEKLSELTFALFIYGARNVVPVSSPEAREHLVSNS